MAETHWFDSEGNELFGVLNRTEDAKGTVLILHGFTSSHIGPKYSFTTLARKLEEHGFNAFRFDYAGSGNSEGKFEEQNIDTAVDDTKNAIAYLQGRGADTKNIGLVGHSMGGTVALLIAEELGTVNAVVTWATVSNYMDTFSITEKERIEKQETIRLFGFDYPTANLQRILDYDLTEHISQLDAPVLIAHGKKDHTVAFNQAEELYDAANEPKQLLALPNTGHDLLHPPERKQLIEETVDWLNQYL